MNRTWKITQYCENPQKYDLSRSYDAYASCEKGGVQAMALCDGASGASLSHIGAVYISEFAAKYFAENFEQLYNAEFNQACEALITFHQAMISHIATIAQEKKNIQILIGRTIQIKELNKFASSVQILAVKEDRVIYFKIGNGSAVIASNGGVVTLSDSVTQDPPLYITNPNPVNMLIGCDFKTFELSDSCYAIALATDGVEFETGLFHNHGATLFYENVLSGIADGECDPQTELQNVANELIRDNMNAKKDNVGISIVHRDRPEEIPIVAPVIEEIPVVAPVIEEEPAVEIAEEPVAEEIEVEIVEEPIEEEPVAEVAEEPVEEEIEVEIVEEPIEEEPAAEVAEEPIEEEIEVEIVEEAVEEEPEVEVIEEAIEEDPAVEIVEEAVEEELAVEIVEEVIEEEPAVEVIEEAIEEEPAVEVIEEAIEEEPAVEVIEEAIEEDPAEEIVEEIEEEEVEIEIVDDSDDEELEIVTDHTAEIKIPSKVAGEPDKVLKPVSVESDKEKKITKTIFKLFSVSIKKK